MYCIFYLVDLYKPLTFIATYAILYITGDDVLPPYQVGAFYLAPHPLEKGVGHKCFPSVLTAEGTPLYSQRVFFCLK